MRNAFWFALGILLVTPTLRADTITLRNGSSIEGKVLSMNEQGIRFESANGDIHFYKDSEVASIKKGAAASAAPAVTAAPVLTGSVTIPQGTAVTVKFDEDVTSKHSPGFRFTTTLESNIVVGGKVAVPAGTKVYGVLADAKQQGLVGRSSIAITLTGFSIGGNVVPIKTEVLAGKGERKLRQGARGAAAGAAIGAAADGGSGAATGAAVGAAASTLRRQTVGVPAGAIQDFHLAEPVTINHK